MRPASTVDGGGMDAGLDAGTAAATVSFVSPMDGARFTQDTLMGGEWAAEVPFEVAATGVARVELTSGGMSLGDVMDGRLTFSFFGAGAHEVAAIGYDGGGAELARDTITIHVDPPADTSCHGMLDALGLDWAVASPTRGIDDPVRVQPIINGIPFRYVSNSSPTAMLMDCQLALALYRTTQILAPYGIDEVVHIGIYNYRCIGGGDPATGCTPSQHAFAMAIDFHEFGIAGGADSYNVETDWNITTRADPCPIPST